MSLTFLADEHHIFVFFSASTVLQSDEQCSNINIIVFLILFYNRMGREKYEPPKSGRKHTIMSQEDQNNGKANSWDELEIKGMLCCRLRTH